MSDHLIAEANRHAKALSKMTLPTTKPNDRDLAWYIAECIDLKKQLKMECAAKREHLRIACAEINELKVKAAFHERENAALRSLLQDSLEWLDDYGMRMSGTSNLVSRIETVLRKEAQP